MKTAVINNKTTSNSHSSKPFFNKNGVGAFLSKSQKEPFFNPSPVSISPKLDARKKTNPTVKPGRWRWMPDSSTLQTKGAETQESDASETIQDKDSTTVRDTMAGTFVSKIIIDARTGRVGFVVPGPKKMILGNVSTDLKPGNYTVRPDYSEHKWVFERGQVKVGKRFDISLEGANPWTLAYPEKLSVHVGLSINKKGGGPENEADLVRIFDEMANLPNLKPPKIDAGPDNFDSVRYDLDYRSEGGNLSKWLRVRYSDGSEVDIHLDTITDMVATPRLWKARQAAIGTMGEYNLNFMVGTFPTIFFIITINPMVASPTGRTSYRASRRKFSKFRSARSTRRSGPASPGKANDGQTMPRLRKRLRPVNGKVNVGGGLESGSENATNLNPIKPGSGGPARGIPNHVKAGFEDIGKIFEPGSAKVVYSSRLRFGDVNWRQAAAGAAKAMPPGGRLMLNVWTTSPKQATIIVNAFRGAGFRQVRYIGSGPGTMISGIR